MGTCYPTAATKESGCSHVLRSSCSQPSWGEGQSDLDSSLQRARVSHAWTPEPQKQGEDQCVWF